MTIFEVTDALNTLARTSSVLSGFQSRIAALHGMQRPHTYKIFSGHTVKGGNDCYAFHDGGRSDLQLNIGAEKQGDRAIFRYGVGLSLYPNQSQPNPMDYIPPKIHALTEYIELNPSIFADLRMWHYDSPDGHTRTDEFPVEPIPATWEVFENFIFIGSYLDKSLEDADQADVSKMLTLLERLAPAVEYVEANYHRFKPKHDGNRISRICWNDKGWVEPSGRPGKSTDESTHEGKYGYGHEEWLADTSKTIDSYHYAFLESVRGMEESSQGKVYNIDLFTVDGRNGKRYAVGKVKNAQIIGRDRADEIVMEYERLGWLAFRDQQIQSVNATRSEFSQREGFKLFNIRFLPHNLEMYDRYRLIKDSRIGGANRYELMFKRAEIGLAIPIGGKMNFVADDFLEPDTDDTIETSVYERAPKPVENVYLHKKVRDRLKNHLIGEYDYCVSKECSTGQGTKIDVVRDYQGSKIYYEVKVYSSIKACIREALGQLLEYAYWPDTDNAKALVVVGLAPLCDDSRGYLQSLRKRYDLPVYYQQFDLEESAIVGGDFTDDVLH